MDSIIIGAFVLAFFGLFGWCIELRNNRNKWKERWRETDRQRVDAEHNLFMTTCDFRELRVNNTNLEVSHAKLLYQYEKQTGKIFKYAEEVEPEEDIEVDTSVMEWLK